MTMARSLACWSFDAKVAPGPRQPRRDSAPGGELHTTELLRRERWPGERVVVLGRKQVPAEHGELAGDGHRGDVAPAASCHALTEGAHGSGRLQRSPGRLHQDVSRPCRSLLGDASETGLGDAGLAHPGREAEVAREMTWGGEAVDVTDRGKERGSGRHVHSRDGYQPSHLG